MTLTLAEALKQIALSQKLADQMFEVAQQYALHAQETADRWAAENGPFAVGDVWFHKGTRERYIVEKIEGELNYDCTEIRISASMRQLRKDGVGIDNRRGSLPARVAPHLYDLWEPLNPKRRNDEKTATDAPRAGARL